MKKQYQKPAAYIESFELVEHIANCNVASATYRNGTDCTYTDANVTVFGASNCATDVSDDVWDGVFDSLQDYLSAMGTETESCYNAFSNGSPFAS